MQYPPNPPSEHQPQQSQGYTQYPQQQPIQPQAQPPQFQAYPQQTAPKKKRSKLPLILGIIAAVLVLGCIGVAVLVSTAAKNVTTGTITTGSNTNNSSSSNGSTTSQIGKVGQTITVSSVATTLVSVKVLASDEFNKPSQGNEFIVVHVKIVNGSDSEQSYTPFDFHVKSGSGNITDETFTSTYTANNQLQSGKLSTGGSVEGDIIFQAPKGDHKAELTWQPSFFVNSGDNGWYLGL